MLDSVSSICHQSVLKMPNASKDIINQRLSNFIEDLSLGKSYTFCINKHLLTIQELINDGYTLLAISNVISEHRPILYTSFRNAMCKARKKSITLPVKVEDQQNDDIKKESQNNKTIEEHQQKSEKPIIDDNTKMKWLKLQITSPTLIERLEKYCVSYDDVRSWNLASEFQVSKRLTELIVMKKVKSK